MSLTEIIPGDTTTRAQNVSKVADINQHKQAIEKEFIGRPRVCAEVAKSIIHIRRNDARTENLAQLNQMLNTHLELLVSNSDIRWLISICDTIVDFGPPGQKPLAMMIVNFTNMLKLWDTSDSLVNDSTINKNKASKYKTTQLWDGVITFDILYGDMPNNMMKRMNNVLSQDQVLNRIWKRIKTLLKDQPELSLNKLQKFHRKKNFWVV